MSSKKCISRQRNTRRGTLLVVVLGLLVALFVIGTSFSYVTLSERRAAANYLDRARALDLALDGVEYTIARLRAESLQRHYQGIGAATAGVIGGGPNGEGGEYDPTLYALRTLDGTEPAVSWPRNRSATSTDSNAPDANWVDADGDGGKGGSESSWGTNLIPAGIPMGAKGFSGTVTGFQGDGLNRGRATQDVPRDSTLRYGPSGTYTELGNYFRVRAVDAASLLNLNNFKPDELEKTLLVLGAAIEAWISGGARNGDYNPFPKTIAERIKELSINQAGIISSKEQLRAVYTDQARGEELYNLAMMFVTTQSYVDNSYRNWCEYNTEVPKNGNPSNLTKVELWREGFTQDSNVGRDGWPDWQHDNPSRSGIAPVNINTAPKPVLVCLFANLAANARLLYYRKQDQITIEDKLYKEAFGATVRRQDTGTTDLGRQNNHSGGPGSEKESSWYPPGDTNRAIFQLVPIGPISTTLGDGATSSGGGQDYASALADAVITLRKQHAFTSWQDFDARFCREMLLGLPVSGRESLTIPDVVGVKRGSQTTTSVQGLFPIDLLPRADNCEHRANPLKNSDVSMNEDAFRAWYWKSCVDMIRAALNPNNVSNRGNPDYPYYQNVDRMDLTFTAAPICFSSMGVYEVTSQGEMLAKPRGYVAGRDTSFDVSQMLPVARRQVRAVVKIYDVLRHTNQRDFNQPIDPIILNPKAAAPSTGTTPTYETLVSHSHYNTKTYPFSINELSNGSWGAEQPNWNAAGDPLEDAQALSYKPNDPGENKIKGHNPWTSASTDYGYVSANPQDRSPVRHATPPIGQLTFWARFNEGLRARTQVQDKLLMFGINSDNIFLDNQWGHYPWEKEALFDDFISTASPRSVEPAIKGQRSEFENSSDGAEATKYSNLRPDGLYLWGGSLRPRSAKNNDDGPLGASFGRRGLQRIPRLKILRYPCGSQNSAEPFAPIRNVAMRNTIGINDSVQVNRGATPQIVFERMMGTTPPFRGHDEHNTAPLVQSMRQLNSNMPYYEGTVDFWIKWDLPPQGTDNSTAVPGQFQNQVVCMGELDPASHNYSGLFGATAYGRLGDDTGQNSQAVTVHNRYTQANNADRDFRADFEGIQFFVYKEPGGVFRFTRLYFAEAFGMAVDTGGNTTSTPQNMTRFGLAMRRIADPAAQPEPLISEFTGTSDICNDIGFAGSNLGFLYARTDAWVNLYEAKADGPGGSKPVTLRVHDWHRFTLSYNSNTDNPYALWIDGRLITPVTFFPEPARLPLGQPQKGYQFRNDGSHRNLQTGVWDEQIPPSPTTAQEWEFIRRVNKLLEINPEDRLTIGCIFRRQPDNTSQAAWDLYYQENPDDPSGVGLKPARPVFKFDSNFVAVANATIDDFRIARSPIEPANTSAVSISDLRVSSRYPGNSDKPAYFEGGFLPIRPENGQLHSIPLRLGTISWTEYRPDWDPFAVRGMNLETSNRLEVEWAVFDDITNMPTGGGAQPLDNKAKYGKSGDMTGATTQSENYWALGGMSLRGEVLPCSATTAGLLVYRVTFRVGDNIEVNNTTAILDDVMITLLTPPRKLGFAIDY